MPPAEKRCPRCRLVLPAAAFYVIPSRHDGLGSYCKPCEASRHAGRSTLDHKWKKAISSIRYHSKEREQIDARRAARLASRTSAQERVSACNARQSATLDHKWKKALRSVLSSSRKREQKDVRRARWDITRAEREAFNREHGKPE